MWDWGLFKIREPYFLRFFFFFKKCYLFWLCWVSAAARGLSLAAVSMSCSLGAVHRLLIAVIPLSHSERSRLMGFSSDDARAKLPCVTWNLPGPGIKPVSTASAGGFLTTGSPGKPLNNFKRHIPKYKVWSSSQPN